MDATALLADLTGAVETAFEAAYGYEGGEVWREEPVSLAVFVTAREHLNLGPLFPDQQAAMDELLGMDPCRIFTEPGTPESTRAYQLAVLLWGKGSGKDYLCSIVVCYLVYVLLCLRDPQGYFDFGRGEPIDVVNVAYNADQAKRVFFEKLKQRILGWHWLADNYNVFESGKRRGRHIAGRPSVEINDGEVLFPRHIRCFSRHAQNESYEGYNVIAWVMDEASAFLSKIQRENADAIYQTLRTSAASRFQRRWVGFIISYPRHGDDFTMTKLAEAQRDPSLGIFADGPRTTWEVNKNLGKTEFVEVRPGHEVPVELANDYKLDYEAALARYECQPPAARDAFIKFPERLDAAVATGKKPLVEWTPIVTRRSMPSPDGEGTYTRRFSGVRIDRIGRLPKGTKVYSHGDPGLKHDSFALALAHGVPATIMVHMPAVEVYGMAECAEMGIDPDSFIEWEQDVVRSVIDALIVWEPDPREDQQVDLLNVREVLLQLVKVLKLGHTAKHGPTLTFDQWNSAETIQQLQAKGRNVEDESWSNPFQLAMYRNARSSFYNDLVTLPDTPTITSQDPLHPGALYELKRLELIEDRKIDHPEGGSKDRADAVARVIQHVTEAAQSSFAFGTAFGHAAKYPRTAPFAPSSERTIDPNATEPMATEARREAEADRRMERPLGELTPDGEINGRRFGFGTVRR